MSKKDDVAVTYQDMRDAAKKLKKDKTELQKTLKSLKKYVENLVKDGYVTQKSSKDFEESFNEFEKGASDTIEGLEGMGDFLTSAADGFEHLDKKLGDGIKGK
ncbi:WXG100 family type VII secretion target [Streptomyces sp. NPDC005336]|uniref:WXG100 family type VII secretion target n=1 Tax=Streptomyces sp. NPDC005336 TaxID=3157035 RepID=UPI0033AF5829